MNLEINSEDQSIHELCCMYWEIGDDKEFSSTVAKIAKEFKITSHRVTAEVKSCCKAHSEAIFCISCDTPYVYQSRQDYKAQVHCDYWECDSCKVKKIELKNVEIQMRLNSFLEHKKQHPFTVEKLSFKQAIYLLSVIRHLATEDLLYLRANVSSQVNLLSPSSEYDMNIFKSLANENILAVSPTSSVDAIELDQEEGFRYYINHVNWEVMFDESTYSSINVLIQYLEGKLSSMEWEDEWFDEAKDLCKEVALEESLSYLKYVMSSHQFDFSPGDKTVLVLSKILEEYSVSQSYNLIWGAAKDAAAYYMRGGIPKPQAANSVVGGIERKYERALTNNWDVKPFSRNYNLPISVLSQALYSTALQTDDGGFHKPINQII